MGRPRWGGPPRPGTVMRGVRSRPRASGYAHPSRQAFAAERRAPSSNPSLPSNASGRLKRAEGCQRQKRANRLEQTEGVSAKSVRSARTGRRVPSPNACGQHEPGGGCHMDGAIMTSLSDVMMAPRAGSGVRHSASHVDGSRGADRTSSPRRRTRRPQTSALDVSLGRRRSGVGLGASSGGGSGASLAAGLAAGPEVYNGSGPSPRG